MIRNSTQTKYSGRSATMSFDNAIWKAALTSIDSNTNAVIMVPQTEA